MLRSTCDALLRPAVAETVPRRFRRVKILTWPIDYLPFKWKYPEKLNLIKNSGDRVMGIPCPERQRPAEAFRMLPELEKAPEPVKRIFSIDFASRSGVRKSCEEDFINLVRRHHCDTSSLEYLIAKTTFRIRALKEEFIEKDSRNKIMKDRLNTSIQKRNKYLKLLGRQDQERYNFVKEALSIDHTPFPLGEGHKQVTRKGELRRLTVEYANKIKEEKLKAYHEQLKQLQKSFVNEKKETEEWITKEIAELDLTESELKQLDFKGILQ